MSQRVAAIDVGTNTTRLLVAAGDDKGYRGLERRLLFTRLGEGVDAGGRLREEAIERTLKAVAEFCALAGELGAARIRIGCTSAVRDASNRDDFTGPAERLGGPGSVRVLAGQEEAELSFLGATSELDAGPCLVLDIGGGSTELIVGPRPGGRPKGMSLDIGSVRLTERHLRSDPPATEEMLMLEAAIDEALDETSPLLPAGTGPARSSRAVPERLVGVAGTITTLAAISLGLEQYDPEAVHHSILYRHRLGALYRGLVSMPLQQRQAIPTMPAGRADVIVAGTAILSRVMNRWKYDSVVVSEKDILDGLIIEMLGEEPDDPTEQ